MNKRRSPLGQLAGCVFGFVLVLTPGPLRSQVEPANYYSRDKDVLINYQTRRRVLITPAKDQFDQVQAALRRTFAGAKDRVSQVVANLAVDPPKLSVQFAHDLQPLKDIDNVLLAIERLQGNGGDRLVLAIDADHRIIPAFKPSTVAPPRGELSAVTTGSVANDEGASRRWNLDSIRASRACGAGCEAPIVAIIGGGVDYRHPGLKDFLWRHPTEGFGRQFFSDFRPDDDDKPFEMKEFPFPRNGKDVGDENGQGTHVAGIIAGVANGRVQIMVLKCLRLGRDGEAEATMHDVELCIDFARLNGAKIILADYQIDGRAKFSPSESGAIGRLAGKDILFIASAGDVDNNNDNTNQPRLRAYPSSHPHRHVLSVTGIDEDEKFNAKLGAGSGKLSVHIAAPGRNVYSTLPGGGYGTRSGTAVAAAHVAGAAALVWGSSSHRNLTAVQLKELLLQNARKLPSLEDRCASEGTLDLSFLPSFEPSYCPPSYSVPRHRGIFRRR